MSYFVVIHGLMCVLYFLTHLIEILKLTIRITSSYLVFVHHPATLWKTYSLNEYIFHLITIDKGFQH